MRIKDTILFNIILIAIIATLYYFNLMGKVILYISFSTKYCNFKDLLSIIATILSIFLGFIATIATVLISMCNKRIMLLIKKYKKVDFLLSSIKKALISGIISLLGIAIIYVNADFNVILIRTLIVYVTINFLYIFCRNSTFLVKLINKILSDSLRGNEDLIVKPRLKKENAK